MHQYLRAVGFSDIKRKKDLKEVLNQIVQKPNHKEFVEGEENTVLVEYTTMFTDSTGVMLRGELDEEDHLMLDFYYPICVGKEISSTEEVVLEQHVDKESFGGLCEDNRFGVSLIFFLQNNMQYMKELLKKRPLKPSAPLYFSGLSLQGNIMLPILKNETQKKKIKETAIARTKLIEAAKNGDENAIENLTLEELDTYSIISKKILKQDLFSLVDTYFMPNGIECDQYAVLGEIEDFALEKNWMTQEEVYVLHLVCNSMPVTVCINAKDLLGEPKAGRRFKGNVWMQGKVELPD